MSKVIALLTHKGADICKLKAGTLSAGAPADICLFDPEQKWTVDTEKFFSKSQNCPWNGQVLKGVVKGTFVDGIQVFNGTSITA